MAHRMQYDSAILWSLIKSSGGTSVKPTIVSLSALLLLRRRRHKTDIMATYYIPADYTTIRLETCLRETRYSKTCSSYKPFSSRGQDASPADGPRVREASQQQTLRTHANLPFSIAQDALLSFLFNNPPSSVETAGWKPYARRGEGGGKETLWRGVRRAKRKDENREEKREGVGRNGERKGNQ